MRNDPSKAGAPVAGRVLLVDDDRDFCSMVSMWSKPEFQLLVAFDGDDGLTIAHRCLPDVALLDVMLPRLSGLGLAWAFRHHAALRDVPVAFITGYDDVFTRVPKGRVRWAAVMSHLLKISPDAVLRP